MIVFKKKKRNSRFQNGRSGKRYFLKQSFSKFEKQAFWNDKNSLEIDRFFD